MMKNKHSKKLGRPPLGAEKRRFRIAASFTLEERDRILEIANWAKISPSDFLYRLAMNQKIAAPPPAVNLAALREINEIGKHLHLLAKADGVDKFDSPTLEKYFAILSELKAVIMEKQENGNR